MITPKRKKEKFGCREKECGLTLIEVVVVLAVSGILFAAVSPYLKINIQSYRQVQLEKVAVQGARIAMNRMIAELERIAPPVLGISYITVYNSTTIRFSYIEDDGSIVGPIEFSFDSGDQTLIRTKSSTDSELSHGVMSFQIQYFNATGGAPASAAAIQRIQLTLTVGQDASTKYTLVGSVYPRNI